ncbi:hypothetical protein SANTM175S_00990 [Streptomyces antimycoticus]
MPLASGLTSSAVQDRVGVPLVVEEGLPLADHPERAVVDDGDLDRDVVQGAGGELLIGHLEAAVAVDRPHRAVGHARLGAHGGGHRVAHGPGAAGVQPGGGLVVLDEVRGPHLVLADARREDGALGGQLSDALDDLLRGEGAVRRQVVAQRVGVAPAVQIVPPGGVVAAVALGVLLLDGLDEVGEDLAGVTDDRHVGGAVLADLRRVDVGVDDLGVRGEAVQLAGDAVVEAGSEGDDQVGLLQRGDGGDRTVHARHSHVQRVAVGERAERHQGGGDGRSGELGEHLQLGGGARLDDAAADVEDGPPGCRDQLGGLADLLGVRLGDGPVAGQVHDGRPGEGGLRLEDVLGDVHQHRAGTAGGGNVEGLRDDQRDVLRLGDQEAVLGDRHGDADDVRLLEGVGADRLWRRPDR